MYVRHLQCDPSTRLRSNSLPSGQHEWRVSSGIETKTPFLFSPAAHALFTGKTRLTTLPHSPPHRRRSHLGGSPPPLLPGQHPRRLQITEPFSRKSLFPYPASHLNPTGAPLISLPALPLFTRHPTYAVAPRILHPPAEPRWTHSHAPVRGS